MFPPWRATFYCTNHHPHGKSIPQVSDQLKRLFTNSMTSRFLPGVPPMGSASVSKLPQTRNEQVSPKLSPTGSASIFKLPQTLNIWGVSQSFSSKECFCLLTVLTSRNSHYFFSKKDICLLNKRQNGCIQGCPLLYVWKIIKYMPLPLKKVNKITENERFPPSEVNCGISPVLVENILSMGIK